MNQYIIEQNFIESVENKFHFLNSVFLGIATDNESGKIISDFTRHVEKCLEKGIHPGEIMSSFFPEGTGEKETTDRLFDIIKFIERQVVIFDAIEDAAFEKINNLQGPNSLQYVIADAVAGGLSGDITDRMKNERVRVVLTAHPTQFYPGTILGIITDLNQAIRCNDLSQMSALLAQLSFTPFFSKTKPTPFDEALSLIWFLENVFYEAILKIHEIVSGNLPDQGSDLVNPKLIELGFWPGGDRDGNPFVTAGTTRMVANRLRSSILQKYHEEVRRLKRRLTFRPVFERLKKIESELYRSIYSEEKPLISERELLEELERIKELQKNKYHGLFVRETQNLINTIRIFQYHFATIDIRQDNWTHRDVVRAILESLGRLDEYEKLSPEEKSRFLLDSGLSAAPYPLPEKARETMDCLAEIKEIQSLNGEAGCNRYIISNCSSETDIYELLGLFIFGGWSFNEITVDIIPLFETIEDLKNASTVMHSLYTNPCYSQHLKRRKNRQTIMLGFSDGTKDGGYLAANWSIYRAKEELTAVSREHGVEVIFFDGRGGPAARGGGKTHAYYAAHGKSIESNELQLTVQGQTVSSNFGTPMSAQYNLEQLVSAGIKNRLYSRYSADFTTEDRALMERLSRSSFEAYSELKGHDQFLSYLQNRTTVPYYGMTNIGSRPDRRKSKESFTLKDLRAIPFVGSWTLNKQNIPGFFGLGRALESLKREGKGDELRDLYRRSLFLQTLVQNSIMVLKKTNFDVTSYMKDDSEYAALWRILHDEYLRAGRETLEISDSAYLMQNNAKDRLSIDLRERIILPLAVIHQYALCMMEELKRKGDEERQEACTHLIIRSSYGIINAGRNSA